MSIQIKKKSEYQMKIEKWFSDQDKRENLEEEIRDLKNNIRDNWGRSSIGIMNECFHDLRILEEKMIDLQIQDCEDFLQKINHDQYGNDPDGFLDFRYVSELNYLKSLKK